MASFTPDYDDTGDGFDVLPTGIYAAVCVGAEEKESTNKPGNTYFNLQWEIEDKPHKGRFVWSMVTNENSSAKAQDIGRQQLNAICKAAGLGGNGQPINIPEDLVMANVFIKVGHEEYMGEKKARVKAYLWDREGTQKTNGRNQRVDNGNQPPARPRSDDEPPF